MWLGIDLGTSSVKSVLLNDAGAIVAESAVPLSIQRPNALWSEQDPHEWWKACKTSLQSLPANLRASVHSIGLSGQMHGAVLIDEAGLPLRPAILWNDGRSSSQCAKLDLVAQSRTGNLAMPGFTAPKLLWVKEHEPEIFAATKTVLLPKDFLRFKLTGELFSDMSDASGTLWLDVAKRTWSAPMLDATGLDQGQMPKLAEGNQVTGQLRSEIANELGIPVVPVAGGGGDQAAGAIGAGVVDPGQAFLSLGTSGVIFAASDGFSPNPRQGVHAFCHALPERWHVMSVMLSAAVCLDWVSKLGGFADVPAALNAAQSQSECTATPIFLPYLSGERTPHNDEAARGVFFGLTHDSDGAALVRSVLQGVAMGLSDGLDALALDLEQLSVIGGGARSPYWAQILADTLQVPLAIRDGASIGPAFGAARLARLAVGSEGANEVCTQPAILNEYEPRTEPSERLAMFRDLYRSLKPHFQSGLT